MSGKRGFTLLELIVASAIMAIAVVGLMAGLSGATRNAARLRNYDRAVQLAQLRMNELLLDDRFPRNTLVEGVFDASLSGGIEAGWRSRREMFEAPPALAPGQLALDRIALEVWWIDDRERRTLTMESYQRRVLRAEDVSPAAVAQ